ncbi:MAG: GDSL family lipase [Gammaproteobacteria bacterium]|nr:GDSL family lipase [Gammaproteobacteria bacterium]MBU1442867.1 GDSL family lipase [Gammaproteobacteria bacterium]MBU2410888.1 GDSL family lipase [Gammaproteobacteria bacterium]
MSLVNSHAARAVVIALAMLGAHASEAQSVSPSTVVATPSLPVEVTPEARWKSDLAAFAAADEAQIPGADGVLFVGSSSIRLWSSLAQDFRQLPLVINRGFGGSTMRDCSLLAQNLVVRYKPRQVFVYAGDNDLAQGRKPMQVLASFETFVDTVRAALPHVRIGYISIKPSPARELLMPQIRETNQLMAAYIKRLPNSDYIDIFTPMVDAAGRPRHELFRADNLHLNQDGYGLWRSIISSYLMKSETPRPSDVAAAPR